MTTTRGASSSAPVAADGSGCPEADRDPSVDTWGKGRSVMTSSSPTAPVRASPSRAPGAKRGGGTPRRVSFSRPVTADSLQRRSPSVDDLPVVLELLRTSDIAVLGRSDFTATEVEADLRDERKEHHG